MSAVNRCVELTGSDPEDPDGYLSLSGFSFGRIRIDARRTGYFVSFAAYTSRGVCVLSSPDQARRSIFCGRTCSSFLSEGTFRFSEGLEFSELPF